MELVEALTLSGSVMKCTAMGRPLSSVSPTFPHNVCSLVHVRLVFGLLQAIQELQAHFRCRLGRLSAGALHVRNALSAGYSTLFAYSIFPIFGCIAAVSGVRAAAARGCEVLPVGRPRRERRAHVQVRIPQRAQHGVHLSTHCPLCSHHHCTPLGCARTGAFCRFAGRPSLGLSAALPALRFDALSIFMWSWSRRLSKPFSGLCKEF